MTRALLHAALAVVLLAMAWHAGAAGSMALAVLDLCTALLNAAVGLACALVARG